HRLRPRHHRGPHQGFLSRGLEHRHFRDHGDRADDPPARALWTAMTEPTQQHTTIQDPVWEARYHRIGFMVLFAILLVAPFVVYPVFLMKALCFALFACAFNLLLGFGGLLSFGHAAYFGMASYVSAYTAKHWGLTPELAILLGTIVAGFLGLAFGALAIRRQGIYFAMITLALAQMAYFFSLQ